MSTPEFRAQRLPAEWEPQVALWLSWPVSQGIWPAKTESIAEAFAQLVTAAASFQQVCINAAQSAHPAIASLLRQSGAPRDQWRLYDHPTNDVWVRDHGPIFVETAAGLALSNWEFNAWGGKFPDYQLDNAVPQCMSASLGLPLLTPCPGYILEGGAIDSNGAGHLLTTEPVLGNANRNPGLDYAAHFERLRVGLGIERMTCLPAGLDHDDTDGHVDNVARFVAPDRVLAVEAAPGTPLAANQQALHQAGLDVVELPDPGLAGKPASYANFVILNGGVLLPAFGKRALDQRAADILKEQFPEREILSLDCRLLLEEGGALHCCTLNQFVGPGASVNPA